MLAWREFKFVRPNELLRHLGTVQRPALNGTPMVVSMCGETAITVCTFPFPIRKQEDIYISPTLIKPFRQAMTDDEIIARHQRPCSLPVLISSCKDSPNRKHGSSSSMIYENDRRLPKHHK